MNNCMNHSNDFYSNKRIIEAYYGESVKVESVTQKIVDAILFLFSFLWKILSSATVRYIAKLVTMAGCLVGFVGIIGAMERGTLGLLAGILIALPLLVVEYFCLSPRNQRP